MASEAGLDIADCAIGSMSSMTSNPCMNSLVEALKEQSEIQDLIQMN
mgnify:CR=1 FL=1